MRLTGVASRLMIFIDDDDTWHHKPLFHEIVHRAHEAGLAATTKTAGGCAVAGLVGRLNRPVVGRLVAAVRPRPRRCMGISPAPNHLDLADLRP